MPLTVSSKSNSELYTKIDFNPFDGNKIEKTVTTSEAQKEIWLSCELGGNVANLAYNQSFSVKLKGSLNIFALKLSIKHLIGRHESLRSTISSNGENIIIYKDFQIKINEKDLSLLEENMQQTEFKTFIETDSKIPFNLHQGPLIRCTIHKIGANLNYFTLTVHHIIGDGWSVGVLLEELGKIYSVYAQGEQPKLTEAPQISAYIKNEIDYKNSREYQQTEEYWLNLYKNEVPVLNIPTDYPRKATRDYDSKRIDLLLNEALILNLKNLSIQSGCSLATILISTFEIFLYKITYQKEIILGLPTAGQPATGNYGLVGHCVNLLPLKTSIDSSISFSNHLKKRKAEIFDAYDHIHLTFGELIKKLFVNRDQSRVTMVPVVLNVDISFGQNISFGILEHSVISNPRAYENFEIFLNISHSQKGTLFEWAYNTALFKQETVQQFHKQFQTILEQIVRNPFTLIENLIFDKKHTCKSRPINKTLSQLFYETVEKHPNNLAVSFNNEALTYRKLNIQSNQLAHLLISMGISIGDKIGLCTDRSIEMITVALAIIKAGATYVPIEPTLPIERTTFILENSNVKILFLSNELYPKFNGNTKKLIIKEAIEASILLPLTNLHIETSDHDAVYILYTSGSTGKPKGVCMGQKALVNLLLWQNQHSISNSNSKTLQFSSLSFDVSFQEIFSTLTTGGNLILVANKVRLDPTELLHFIAAKDINRIFMPFVALQALAENSVTGSIYPTKLLEVVTAGEQLKITPQIREFFNNIPRSYLYNQYGPTECHVVTELKLSGNPDYWPILPSIGKEIYNTKIFILDQNLQEVRPGEIGELCISGYCLAEGYLNLENITSEKFITFINNKGVNIRIYRTGDLARLLPGNNIEFLGREDYQVKIRGYRVELGEIEHLLISQKGIKDAVVVAREDIPGVKHLVAYLIQENETFDHNHQVLKDRLKKSLPDYMIPQQFMSVDKFPTTSTGKIDRNSLPQPEKTNQELLEDYSEPQTNEEKIIANIWSYFLNSKNISIQSNFFELGGHSLIAVRVMIEIEKQLGLKMSISTLFENSTIKKLADIITCNKKEIKWDSLVSIKPNGSKIPFYLVHGLGLNVLVFESLSNHLHSEQPFYALQGIGLNGRTTKPLSTMEELAQHYNSEILENDPVGPYALGGYSFGGLLAYEMAKQLIEMGKEVKTLAIIDTYAGNDDEELKTTGIIRKAIQPFLKFFFYSKFILKYPKNVYIRIIHELKTRLTNKIENELLEYNKEINKSYRTAYENYKVQPANVKIDLFKSKERGYFLNDSKYYSWKKHALQGVNTYDIPGNHKTCLLKPNVEELANILQTVLDKNIFTNKH